MEKRISGTTGLLALIGSPVGHSGSPAMYNFSFQHDGVDYAYVAFDINVDEVKDAIHAMRLFKMRGCNVTMPCKTEVVKYMDELSPAARMIGAVNTIVNEDGRLVGHNTDGIGFVRNLKEHGVDVKGKKVVILGAGGAATAIQVQCALDGAREITIFKRNNAFYSRVLEMAEKIRAEVPECTVNVCYFEDEEKLASEIATADILVNGTSVGMKPNDGVSPVKKELLHKDLVVSDIVYNPKVTKLMADAQSIGCKVVGGKGMLLWQGAAAYKLYTGLEMPVEEYQKYQAEQEVN